MMLTGMQLVTAGCLLYVLADTPNQSQPLLHRSMIGLVVVEILVSLFSLTLV